MGKIEKAKLFAKAAHAAVGQLRKYTNEPYHTHPEAVADIVASVTSWEAAIAAAHLHDVVEDTRVTLDMIHEEFGRTVANLVEELTDVSRPEDGDRATRKAIDRAHTAKASPWGKTVKLADLIHNTQSIVANDPKFARVYLAEKELLLQELRDGNPILWNMANDLLHDSMAKLGMVSRCE